MKNILKLFRYGLALVALFVLVYAITHYRLVGYGLSQLRGQLSIIINSRKVEECLADPAFPDSLRIRLLEVQRIRRFAIDSLGLHDSRNYTTFYDQKGKPSLWVLTACGPYELKAFEWEFPFLGKVPYKGFFDYDKGLSEELELSALGYDTEYSPVGGWSTLGFLPDPILSNMLRRSTGSLAELIIHELTHATVYLPGSTDYNENFATFVGEEGARKYLAATYGDSSIQLSDYLQKQEDEALFGEYMLQSAGRLDSLYRAIRRLDQRKKKMEKERLIQNIVLNINTIPLRRPERYAYFQKKENLPDNCFFMGYRRYRRQQGDFKKQMLEAGGNLKAWLEKVKNNPKGGAKEKESH
jgi:predicted aminopeptidase